MLWLMRRLGPQHLDDVHPTLPCSFMARFVGRPQQQYLWIMPIQNDTGISRFPNWCTAMRRLHMDGKVILGMHGVYHDTNDEFLKEFTAFSDNVTDLLDRGVAEFRRCFHIEPSHFAPPGQLISPANLAIVRHDYHMRVRTAIDGLTSRIYHCDDSFCPNPIFCTTAFLDTF